MKLFLLICSLSLFSHVQAQTKEETIKWIKEKIRLYGTEVSHVAYQNGTENTATLTINGDIITEKEYDGQFKKTRTKSIDLNDITSADDFFDSNRNPRDITGFTKGLKVKHIDDSDGEVSYYSSFDFKLKWYAEEDLFNRFYKAMRTLAAYNKANEPKEAF